LRLFKSSIRLHETSWVGGFMQANGGILVSENGRLAARCTVSAQRTDTANPEGQGQDRKSPFTRWKKNSLAQPAHS